MIEPSRLSQQMGKSPAKSASHRPVAQWDKKRGRPEPIRLLNQVVELENHEPLVNVLDRAPRVISLRLQVIPLLRETVANMLLQASESLPQGYGLGIVDAWRPIIRQQRIWDFMWQCGKEAFPDRNDIALRRTVCRWVAPTDHKTPPGHCTGAAVDVWLVNNAGEPIDVCAPYDRFGAGPTYSYGLTEEAQLHREMLVGAMLGAGFSNCRDEWWHYSYGDAGWAVRMGLETCHYGLAELPESLWIDQERFSEEAFKNRPNPFLVSMD